MNRDAGASLRAAFLVASLLSPVAAAEPSPAPPVPEAYLAFIERLWAGLDLTELDLEAAAADAGTDPTAIRAWVERRIRYEPYRGVLRGSRGTLLAGAGNSQDRSLLLASFLRAAGHRVRFAEGTLSLKSAESLVRGCVSRQDGVAPPSPLRDEIIARAQDQYLLLGDALHDAKVYAPAADPADWKGLIDEARAHTWVEVEKGGAWIGLDSSPGAADGRPLAAAERTSDDLAPEQWHAVTLRLVAEISSDDQRVEESLLELSSPAAELAGVPLALFFEVSGDQAAPVLLAGSNVTPGKPIPTVGEPQGGDFFPLPGVGVSPSPVTALWLRVSTTGPGNAEDAECALFDALGPAARKSGGAARAGAPRFTEAIQSVFGMGVFVGGVGASLPLALLASAGNPFTREGVGRLLSVAAFDYLAAREGLPASLVEPPAFGFVSAPKLLVVGAQVRGTDSNDVSLAIDLTLSGRRLVRAPGDPFADGLFFDRLSSSVLDHMLERALFGDGQADGSVGSLFEAASAQAIPLAVFTKGDPPPPELPLGADGALLALRDAGEGRIVIAPSQGPIGWKPGDLGWWAVDPATGRARDTAETGWHQAGERAVQEKDNIRNRQLVCILALKIIVKVAIPIAVVYGVLPPDTLQILDAFKVKDVLDAAEKGACKTKGPIRRDNPMPGDRKFPPRAGPPPNNAPNQFKNPPVNRWPRGAPRGR